MTPNEFDGLMKQFIAKARCTHTQKKAMHLWDKIKHEFTKQERLQIIIAWNHYIQGEGCGELDEICNQIWIDKCGLVH